MRMVRVTATEALDLNYPRCCLHAVNVWCDWYWVDGRRVRRQRRRAWGYRINRRARHTFSWGNHVRRS